MATIVHFDINANNIERAKLFYEKLFGWKFEKLPMNYYMISTEDIDGNPGIGGGLSTRHGGDTIPPAGVINYIGVSSLEGALKQVITLGGKVLTEQQSVPGYGILAVCSDTEGNVFGLFEEKIN